MTPLFFVSILAPPLKGSLSVWVWIRVIYLFLSKQNKSHLLGLIIMKLLLSLDYFVCRILLLFQVSYMGLSPLITCLGFYYYYYYDYYLGWLEELLFEIRFGKWSTFCIQISNKWDKYVYYFSSNVYLMNTHFNI